MNETKDDIAAPKGDLLTTSEAARYLRVSPITLEKWRRRLEGYGPAFVRMGSKVFYRRATLDEFIQSREGRV